MWKKTNSREQRKKACPDDPRTQAKKADGAWGRQARESYFSFLLTTFSSFFLLLRSISSSSPFPSSFSSTLSSLLLLFLLSPSPQISFLLLFLLIWNPSEGPIPSLSLSNFPPQISISTSRDAVFDLCLLGRLAKRSRQGILGFKGM